MSEHAEADMTQRIKSKLEAALAPTFMEVIDESDKHAGHAHAITRPGTAHGSGGTHFQVKVISEAFAGKSRVDRHRTINAVLKAELADTVHALSIEAKAPGE
jgi:BolA family transcriptional regulator, general stress-responsive regulator